MADAERLLGVWCFDELAGTLADGPSAMAFTYAEDWIRHGRPPLSQSLPLDGTSSPVAAQAFFGGLLPEGVPREQLARRLGISAGNDFGLLAAVAGDTAGAITIRSLDQPEPQAGPDVDWLDDRELVELVEQLPTRPMHADEDGEFRLSLAGAQDKLPVVVGDGGRIGITKGRAPSTHILKTPIARLDGTVINEAFSLAIGRELGIDVVAAMPHRVADHEFLLVERYDRRPAEEATRRLHQEDFCQALGIPVTRKYQAEGGPSLPDCFALLRGATAVPAREVLKLLDFMALSFLVGNHDAHGKNYSLLYLPETARAILAPAYDIVSTFAYHKSHNLTRKMAMAIGGEYRPDYVRPRHLDRLLDDAGLGAAAARRRLRGHAVVARLAAAAARAELAAQGWDAPVLDRITAIVEQRAEWLKDMTAPRVSKVST